MIKLLALSILIGLGVYYVTKLDFEWGTGISEEKRKAREAEYTEHTSLSESSKELPEKEKDPQ